MFCSSIVGNRAPLPPKYFHPIDTCENWSLTPFRERDTVTCQKRCKRSALQSSFAWSAVNVTDRITRNSIIMKRACQPRGPLRRENRDLRFEVEEASFTPLYLFPSLSLPPPYSPLLPLSTPFPLYSLVTTTKRLSLSLSLLPLPLSLLLSLDRLPYIWTANLWMRSSAWKRNMPLARDAEETSQRRAFETTMKLASLARQRR